jgi:hypothetical protein
MMNLQENIKKIKKMMNLVEDTKNNDEVVNIKGKVIDLSNLSGEEKEELKLKEKVIVDKKDKEYPIVMVKMRNGKVIVFDVDGSIKDTEQDPFSDL